MREANTRQVEEKFENALYQLVMSTVREFDDVSRMEKLMKQAAK